MIDQSLILTEDANARVQALDLTSFIVEAPAGAGKTELLTQRYLKLLTVVESPEEIIAITFTNKAAAEMRSRILDSLMQAAASEQPSLPHKQKTYALSLAALEKSNALDWQLLDNPARLRIFTIDGLCAYLARQMPLMSRFGSQPQIADDASLYYAQAVEKTLALIDDKNNQAVVIEALRYLDNDTNQLKNLLMRMLSQRDQWLHHAQKTISPEALQTTLQFIVGEELAAIASVINASIQHDLMSFARYAAGNLSCEHSVALLNEWQTTLPIEPNSLLMWQAVADLLLTGKGELRKNLTVKEGFPATGKEQKQDFKSLLDQLRDDASVLAALQRIRVLPQLNNQHHAWQMITTLSQLLNIAAAQLWLVFSQAKEVDFVEVSQRAISALVGEHDAPTDLALRLDYQIKHLLVDEFQDTSPSQISLLEKLTHGWQAEDGRTIFLVGDPMQSIYRFRKANVGLFLNAAQHGIGDVALISLRLYRNNRSCPAVVDWINQTFHSIFPTHDNTAKGAIAYRPFIATKASVADEGIAFHPIIKRPDVSNEEAAQLEAEAVVDVILKTRASHPAANIAILVRAKSHLHHIVSLLRRQHQSIAFQAVEIEALANRQIVQDLLALTRALYHRADRVNWLATLRAPWCGLSLHDLHALAGHDHYSTIWSLMQRDDLDLSEEGRTRLTHVRTIFDEAFMAKGRVNISRWVRGVWLMLGGASCLWAETDVVDVQAFFDCIERLDRNNEFTLVRMESEMDKLFAAPDAKGEALQMMTIHKSKGLEFDTVILPGLGNRTGGHGDKPIVLWEEVTGIGTTHRSQQEVALLAAPFIPKGAREKDTVNPYDYLNALEQERDQNEDARILYVAATRTVRQLHLVGIANQNKKEEVNATKNTYLSLLWPVASGIYASQADMPIVDNKAQKNVNDIEAFVPKLLRLEQPMVPPILATDHLLHAQKTFQNQSNTPVVETVSIESAIGTLTHQYLELMMNQAANWDRARISALQLPMQQWFVQAGFTDKESSAAAKQVQHFLITTISTSDGQWVLQAHTTGRAEMSVMHVVNGESKRLIVDRTFIVDTHGKQTRWIVDYKTVKLAHNVTEEAMIAQAKQYQQQLATYASLFVDEGLPMKQAVFFVSIGRLQLI